VARKKDDLREFALRAQLEDIKVAHARELRAIKAEATELRAQNKALLERVDQQEVELDAYAHALRPRRAPRAIRPARRAKAFSESTLVVVASDWHVDEIVEPSTVAGLNSYNPDIARARSERFWQGILRVLEMARAHTTVDNLVVGLIGDFISGYIHEELVATTAMPPLEGIDFATDLVRRGLTLLVEHGKCQRIVVPCVAGNHGRMTRRRWLAHEAGTNLEHFMFRRLVDDFQDVPGVEILVGESIYHDQVEVYGRRLRFCHGETLKYAGGLQGMYGRLYKLHLEQNRITPAFWTICGHWHQLHLFQGLGIVNGSLIGTSAYGSQFGHEPPRQGWGLIEKDRGTTAMGPIFVEKA
jgi:hypothetical protein